MDFQVPVTQAPSFSRRPGSGQSRRHVGVGSDAMVSDRLQPS